MKQMMGSKIKSTGQLNKNLNAALINRIDN